MAGVLPATPSGSYFAALRTIKFGAIQICLKLGVKLSRIYSGHPALRPFGVVLRCAAYD